MIKMTKAEKVELKESSREFLLRVLPPKTDVYTMEVARVGFARSERPYTVVRVLIVNAGCISDVSIEVARVLDARFDDKRRGVRVYGVGSEPGHDVVYNLALDLYNDGAALRRVRL